MSQRVRCLRFHCIMVTANTFDLDYPWWKGKSHRQGKSAGNPGTVCVCVSALLPGSLDRQF